MAALIIVVAIGALAAWAQYGSQRIPRLQEARAVAAFPHDPRAFTQGLIFHDGCLIGFMATGNVDCAGVLQALIKDKATWKDVLHNKYAHLIPVVSAHL